MPDPAPESVPEFDPLLPDQSEAKPAFTPTAEQLVSPPPFLRGKELAAWFAADLENAIGAEWIDRDGTGQLYVKRPRKSAAPVPEPEPQPIPQPPPASATGQGELF